MLMLHTKRLIIARVIQTEKENGCFLTFL